MFSRLMCYKNRFFVVAAHLLAESFCVALCMRGLCDHVLWRRRWLLSRRVDFSVGMISGCGPTDVAAANFGDVRESLPLVTDMSEMELRNARGSRKRESDSCRGFPGARIAVS